MAIDYLEIGSSPYEEDCVQVEPTGAYYQPMKEECRRYKELLERLFPPPSGARFGVKSFEHDFGTYMEVCVFYDDDDQEATDFALMVEHNLPARWS